MANLSLALIEVLDHHARTFELSLQFCSTTDKVSDFLHRDYGEMTSLYSLAADYSHHDEVFYAKATATFQKCQALSVRYWALMDEANPADSKSGLAKAEEKQ